MVSFSRLSKLMAELWGVTISEGAIANMNARAGVTLGVAAGEIAATVRASSVIASDETSTLVNGKTWWQWVISSATGVYHPITDSRAAHVVKGFLDGAVPLRGFAPERRCAVAAPLIIARGSPKICTGSLLRSSPIAPARKYSHAHIK